MGKYIIDVKDGETLYKAVIASDGDPYITPAMGNVYTEPDLEQVREEAFKNGYDAACKDIDIKSKTNAAYQKGLEDAWEAARKIIHMPEGDLLNIFTECYSAVCTALQVLLKYDASEAIEKIRQYEQGKKEELDGLRQNIQTIVDKCGYTLDEIAAVLEKMREGQEQ